MDFQAIVDRLKAVQAPGIVEVGEPRPADKAAKDKGRSGQPFVRVEPDALVEFLTICRDEPHLRFEMLVDICASDPGKDEPELWILIQLLSVELRHRLFIKAHLPKEAPRMPTTTAVYRAAQWHERECAEMFGVTFEGHPDPRHILLPDDWEGHPLRKDYEFPTQYRGISCD